VVEVAPDKVLITGRHIGEGLASGAEISSGARSSMRFAGARSYAWTVTSFSDKDSVSELVRSIEEGDLGAEAGTTARP
jgi:hypothetical protein